MLTFPVLYEADTVHIPFGIKKFVFNSSHQRPIWIHLKLDETKKEKTGLIRGDFALLDEMGLQVGKVTELILKEAPKDALLRSLVMIRSLGKFRWKMC